MRIALGTRHPGDVTSLVILGSLARALAAEGHRVFPYKSCGPLRGPIRRSELDVIHLRVGGTHRNPLVLNVERLVHLAPGPVLSLQFDDFGNPDLPEECPRAAAAIGRLIRSGCVVTAVSRAVKSRIICRWPEASGHVHVIGHGVDPAWARTARTMRGPGDGSDGGRSGWILTVGRQARYKGLDLILFVFAGLAREFPRLRLMIAGPDPEPRYLLGLTESLGLARRVEFTGPVGRRKLAGLLRGARIYACASRWESFGIAALEAMVAGKAVVAPRVGGFPDYIQDGKNGLLFPPGNAAALEHAMRRLLERPSLAASLGRLARHAAQSSSWDAVADQYLRLWRTALNLKRLKPKGCE